MNKTVKIIGIEYVSGFNRACRQHWLIHPLVPLDRMFTLEPELPDKIYLGGIRRKIHGAVITPDDCPLEIFCLMNGCIVCTQVIPFRFMMLGSGIHHLIQKI